MNNNRKNILAIVAIVLVALFISAVVYVSYRLGTGQGIIPTAPLGSRACNAQCPVSSNKSLLISCTPSSDGTYQSLCNTKGRTEPCGGRTYCCPRAGGDWTTNMTACATPTPTSTTSPTLTISPTPSTVLSLECGVCTSNSQCSSGLFCDLRDGRCKKADGSTTCWEGSAACITTGTVVCVPSATVTCSPDCPTACGKKASTISTCTNSCGGAATKSCPATNACQSDITVSQKTYKNEAGNTPGNYQYLNEINTVSRNQTFVYDMIIENKGEVEATNLTISNTLNDQNQGQLTFMDVNSGCTYSSAQRKVTCSGKTVAAGQKIAFAFRVKVSNTAVNGEKISNTVVLTGTNINLNNTKDLTISSVVACNQVCTSDSECISGLTCDGTSNTCRRAACTSETDCSCPVTVTTTPTATATVTPTTVVTTTAPTSTVTPTATLTTTTTISPTGSIASVPTVTEGEADELPETGILDFPGIAAFGGGLLLAIVGILLAL